MADALSASTGVCVPRAPSARMSSAPRRTLSDRLLLRTLPASEDPESGVPGSACVCSGRPLSAMLAVACMEAPRLALRARVCVPCLWVGV